MLNVALKEWAVVCDLMLEGKLALLLRKGGIEERGGPGVFALEHERFLLWPSWAHQIPQRIKPGFRDRVQVMDEPATITFHGLGAAAGIWQVPSRAAFDQLEDLHPWSPPQVTMRFNYKPDKPLYLLAVRVSKLAKPRTVSNIPAYAGCRSWVPLSQDDAVDDAGATPVLADDAFVALLTRMQIAMRV